jgi:glycosyltransferase involved in cell wall biosynthesis
LNPNRRPGEPVVTELDEDWRRRLTKCHTRCAQNDRVAGDISVVMPVYNAPAKHLHECMRSLFAQNARPREILIVDGGTTLAETDPYLSALQALPGLRLVRNDRNIRLGRTMNGALRQCQTAFALKLDSDDLARPRLVEKYAAFLAQHREVDVAGCQCRNLGESSIVSNHPERVTRNYVLTSPRFWFVNHTGVLLNKHSVLAVNGYRPMRRMAEDYELWLRMMLRGYRRFYNLPDVLVDYRDLPTGLHHNFRRV